MSSSFTDDRGTITDVMVTPDYSITHITFKKGAVRGNHYHNHTKQVDVVLKGKLFLMQAEVVDGSPIDVDSTTLEAEERITHHANTAHAYEALEDSEMLSICFGVRRGTDYEKDVIRLSPDKKLI